MGGAFNAATTESVTNYFFTVPKQDLDVALHIHAIRMKGADMSDAEWLKERGAIEQEVSRDLSSPTFKFYTDLRERLFAGTPYAHTPLGTRPSFDKTTGADLAKFYRTWYAPNNAILVIAGDVDPQATMARVRSLFSDIPRKTLPARPAFALQPVAAHTVDLPSDLPYGVALISYRMPGYRSKDYATALVLSQAMGSKRAPLFEMGLNGKALYGGFAGTFLPQGGLAYAQGVFPRGAKPDDVLATMRQILADAGSKGIAADLVTAAKDRAIADLDYGRNSVSGLANAWSEALAVAGASSPDEIRAAIARVTPADVDALARRVFASDQAITAILTPADSGKPVSGKGFGGAESFGGTPDHAVELPDWAKDAFARLPAPSTAMKPTSFTLANGLRVIVQPETVSHTVEVYGRIKTNSDLQAPAGKEGVDSVLGDLFDYGPAGMDRTAFQTQLDAISAHEDAGESFSLAVPSQHFARGMELLAQNELNPTFAAQPFTIARNNEAQGISGVLQSPDFLNSMALNRALLPDGDLSLRHPTPETLGSLTPADVQAYYKATFRPDMTTIVVIGDVTPDAARAVVEKTFGGWQASGVKPQTDYPAVPLGAPSVTVNTPTPTAVQDDVTMAQQVSLTRDSADRFALNAGNFVLSGGFYAARLTRDLREKNGLIYTVQSGLDLDRNRGRFLVQFGSDPQNVDKARDLIVRDIRQMQQAPISDAELHQVKGMLVRQMPLSQASFSGIASQLLTYSLEDKPLDADLVAARQYLALTPQQIQNAFATYLKPDGFVTAIKGPAPK
ncbi:M16 family metallopeptidase [Novosphingobium sp. 9]|uniref:M16 family metallopeptidase n=1 Tax=Novosphingobium sp. 9 TaxID=2025349 RepID=UPI0021B6D6DB|nr:pitrilysin family protein [Novosphingobium sp. 9]